MDMNQDSKELTIRWLATPGGVLPGKKSPGGTQVEPRPLREGRVLRTKGKLRLREWGQHGWVDIARAVAEGDFATTIAKVELSDNEITDGHLTCARSMRVIRVIDATIPIAQWVVGQAELLCSDVDGGLKRVYVDLIENAKSVVGSPKSLDPEAFENLHAGIEVLTSDHGSLLERAIVAAANLARVACVSFNAGVVAKALRLAILALVKLGDKRLEYPDGLSAMLLALFGDAPSSSSNGQTSAGAEPSGGSVQSVAGTVDVERSVDEQRQGAPEPSVQISEPETNGEHDAEKTIERTTPRAKSILADIPDFDRRVLGRLRMEPPKTNLRMQVIAHEFKRPEEEIRAAVRRLAALGLAGFGNRFRRDAHATYQPTLAGKPVDEWLPLAMEHISGAPKISIAALAHALGMEREEAIQICTMLEQRGTIRLSGPGKSLVEAKSMNERVAARKTRKGSMTSPTMASKSGDELTRRTSGTAKAEQVLSIRPTSPPTRRVQHADC
jgi:DNA-binding Lrp family transcriptional regulator